MRKLALSSTLGRRAVAAAMALPLALALTLAPSMFLGGFDIVEAKPITMKQCAAKGAKCLERCEKSSGGKMNPKTGKMEGMDANKFLNCNDRTCGPQSVNCEKNASDRPKKAITEQPPRGPKAGQRVPQGSTVVDPARPPRGQSGATRASPLGTGGATSRGGGGGQGRSSR